MTNDEETLARDEIDLATLNALIERDTDLSNIDAGMTAEEDALTDASSWSTPAYCNG